AGVAVPGAADAVRGGRAAGVHDAGASGSGAELHDGAPERDQLSGDCGFGAAGGGVDAALPDGWDVGGGGGWGAEGAGGGRGGARSGCVGAPAPSEDGGRDARPTKSTYPSGPCPAPGKYARFRLFRWVVPRTWWTRRRCSACSRRMG